MPIIPSNTDNANNTDRTESDFSDNSEYSGLRDRSTTGSASRTGDGELEEVKYIGEKEKGVFR
ncbi:hypothetical protein RCZ04_01820 [Capnocytophaga sp. HP1101]